MLSGPVLHKSPYLQGLFDLGSVPGLEEARATFRSAIAAIAQACAADEASPLEGASGNAVLQAVRIALAKGFLDDLGWLSGASAATAVYELAAALPPSNEKRELGRRTLAWMLEGDAKTFVALATRMALGSGKGLSGQAVKSRIALALALPPHLGVRVAPLALALASRRELAREWLRDRAVGSLSDRRLAGRLLEHAARGIAAKVASGDEAALRVVGSDAFSFASQRLRDDREPLVWRHVAVADGLLSQHAPGVRERIEKNLAPELGITEWRRGATALVASLAVAPHAAARKLREVLPKLLARDPGAAAALAWGLPAAFETEPEAATDLFATIAEMGEPLALGEAFLEIAWQLPRRADLEPSLHGLRERLLQRGPSTDDGETALVAQVAEGLQGGEGREPSITDAVAAGLAAFAQGTAKEAFDHGLVALSRAEGAFENVAALDDDDPSRSGAIARRAAFVGLREIDAGTLEDSLLVDLLVLGGRSPDAQDAILRRRKLFDALVQWIVLREERASASRAGKGAHLTIRQRRLRTLLHLADQVDEATEASPFSERSQTAQVVERLTSAHARARTVVSLATQLLSEKPPPALVRMLTATLARGVDALIRVDAADPADVVLTLGRLAIDAKGVETLCEASMNEDLRTLAGAWARFLTALSAESAPLSRTSADESGPSSLPPISLETATGRHLRALVDLSKAIGTDASMRTESLRAALSKVGRALVRIQAARSLTELSGQGSAVVELEQGTTQLAHLAKGAKQRMREGAEDRELPSFGEPLSSALDVVLATGERDDLGLAVAEVQAELTILVPHAIASVVSDVIARLSTLPNEASAPAVPEDAEPPLPAWLPPKRTLGGFYVVRALGSGTGGTVFMAKRIEEKNDADAERFALKVPSYDAAAARALTEEEFMKLFREEATALLGLPAHRNLAGFVTFDLAARPKPILVMELVEGVSLDRLTRGGGLTTARVAEILDGMLAGLECMHSLGIGHLDLKPSNVILRDGKVPVLVDFGLAGRHIRPGCATLGYAAPEILGVVFPNHSPQPPPCDVYAFGCIAFELMTTFELFDAPNEYAFMMAHLTHDGDPPALLRLRENRAAKPLADIISRCMIRHPKQRANVVELRDMLRRAAPLLGALPWPVQMPRIA